MTEDEIFKAIDAAESEDKIDVAEKAIAQYQGVGKEMIEEMALEYAILQSEL